MSATDEIFRAYVSKRLEKDHSFGTDDFPLTESDSLRYLSDVSGIQIQDTDKTKTVIEEDGYEKKRYIVADITPQEFVLMRAENIDRMTSKLSSPLAQKIKTFEEYTKYLYVNGLATREDVLAGLDQAKTLFKSSSKENTEIKELIDKHKLRIAPGLSRKAQNQLKASQEDARKQTLLYTLIQDVHKPHTPQEKAKIYLQILNFVDFRNHDDIRGFIEGDSYKISKDLKARLTTELKRDILQQIVNLCRTFNQSAARYYEQDLEAYNKAFNKFDTTKRLLGKNGAFEKGGLYGPDSKFAGKSPSILQNTSATQTPSVNTQPKKEKIIELSLFSPKHFEY